METGRRHDSYLLSQSNLNNRLAEVQQGNSVQYKDYGDAAYPIMSHIDRGFKGANLTPEQSLQQENVPVQNPPRYESLSMGGLRLVLSYLIGSIDGTIRKMCRPGGDDDLQRECYDGHHKVHGLVSKSVVFADGII